MSVGASRDRAWWEGRQRVLNARPVPPRRAQVDAPAPVAVAARIVWERDGAEVVSTRVVAWTRDVVLVELADARCEVRAVWLVPADVRRTGPRSSLRDA